MARLETPCSRSASRTLADPMSRPANEHRQNNVDLGSTKAKAYSHVLNLTTTTEAKIKGSDALKPMITTRLRCTFAPDSLKLIILVYPCFNNTTDVGVDFMFIRHMTLLRQRLSIAIPNRTIA